MTMSRPEATALFGSSMAHPAKTIGLSAGTRTDFSKAGCLAGPIESRKHLAGMSLRVRPWLVPVAGGMAADGELSPPPLLQDTERVLAIKTTITQTLVRAGIFWSSAPLFYERV